MQVPARRSTQLTAVLLVASLALIAPGLLGLGASVLLGAMLLAAAIGLFAWRRPLASVGPVGWVAIGPMLGVAWLGPALAGLLVLVASGATPGELQAYGGLLGLLGMLNYFLRPVYGLLYGAGRYVSRALGDGRQP